MSLPLWKIMDFVSWDDEIPIYETESHKFHISSHHQADEFLLVLGPFRSLSENWKLLGSARHWGNDDVDSNVAPMVRRTGEEPCWKNLWVTNGCDQWLILEYVMIFNRLCTLFLTHQNQHVTKCLTGGPWRCLIGFWHESQSLRKGRYGSKTPNGVWTPVANQASSKGGEMMIKSRRDACYEKWWLL